MGTDSLSIRKVAPLAPGATNLFSLDEEVPCDLGRRENVYGERHRLSSLAVVEEKIFSNTPLRKPSFS